ncbi:gustatory receptor family protein 3-like [Haliotis asinina]|uniref:gustatory receptor family protein 3-like n=1 Tax=Haliotis asinina TaxID=109174 RepID=UPI003531AEE0
MEVETITKSGVGIHRNQTKKTHFPSIEDKLKPLLVSMKILGIYFDPTQAKNKVEPSETYASKANPPGWWRSVNRLYCYTVLLLLWFNFGRCAVGLFPHDGSLPLRIITTSWMLHCALNATIIIAACQKFTHLRSFYKHWDSLYSSKGSMASGYIFPLQCQCVRPGSAAGWLLTLVNIAAVYVLLFGDLPVSPAYIQALTRPFPASAWMIIFNMVLHVFQSGAWIFPVVFIAIFARILRGQFIQLGKILSKKIDEADGHFPCQLPELRFHYTQLCQAVDIVNRSFKWLLGVRVIFDMFLACFAAYQIINGSSDTFVIAVDVFWLGGGVLCIIVSALCSSDVHDAAHSLLDDIFSIGTQNVTVEQLAQLNLFLAKMTGTSIGFTAIDFFVITKEFLLTLGGLFMTYFFLLLQFKIA